MVLLLANLSLAQSPTFLEPCAKGKEPPAELGPQQPTLCQRYTPNPSEPQPPAFQIGSPGRQLASQIVALLGGSNQLPGVVSVVGNFTVDVDFTFINTVAFISPNVLISVSDDRLFTLENAKLFCCSGLWRGIYLNDGADIDSKSSTEIEDAIIAVDVPCRRSQVFINNTTFNRNIIGIRVGILGQLQAPCLISNNSLQFETFSGNTFSCTSPLNGPQSGTGLAGIQVLGNRILRVGTLNSAPSLFTQIRYGIFSPLGTGITTLIVNRCHFENILDSGISQSDGTLTTNECHFTNCFANGIVQGFTRDLTVDLCRFVYMNGLNGAASDFHNGIFATEFALGTEVSITHSFFEISHDIANGISRGIHLDGGVDDVSAETSVTISNNDFVVQTGGCTGLYMAGDFMNLTPGESSIFNNNFTLFNHDSYVPLDGADLEGDFQRFSIQANDVFGLEREDLTANKTRSITLWGSGVSIENEISSNIWHLPDLPTNLGAFANTDLFFSLRVTSQDLASICYNQFFNVTHAGSFWALGHSVYSNNICACMAHGPHIADMIGAQPHQGNQWAFPIIDIEGDGILRTCQINEIDGYHIRCTGDPLDSHFLVHTEQAAGLMDYVHPFHPFVIIPDLDDELFEHDPGGTPLLCVLNHLVGDVSELDKALADGNMAALQEMTAAEIWQHQRNLYRLLQTDPDYLSAYSGFPNFIAQHQNGSIGKFYQINTLLAQSATISEGQKLAAFVYQASIRDNVEAITQFDNLLAAETNPTTIATLKAAQAEAAVEIETAQEGLNNLQQQYQASREAFYPQALSINAQVNATAVHEINEKAVNLVVLNALINQEGGFTEQDAQLLNGIAIQCPKIGGTAVIKARSLLDDCYETPVNDDIAGCMGELSTESMLSLNTATGNRGNLPSTTSTAIVLGQEIILDVPFEFGARYSFYDLNGRTLQSGELGASLRFQMPSGLATGIYICSVTYASGKVTTQKIVLAH